jgi:hypothetical protein
LRAALLITLVLLAVASAAGAGVVPQPGEAPGIAEAGEAPAAAVRVWVDEERRVVVEDEANQYRLSVPGPYWECKMPDQLGGAGGGGCAARMRPRTDGFLLSISNKDAPAAMALQVLPDRFRVRSTDDLEGYVAASQAQLRKQAGGTLNFLEQSWERREDMIVHRTSFTRTDRNITGRYVLVRYFVRPEDEDVRVFQLIAMATEDEFAWQEKDFEHVIDSFRFSGIPAAEFFEPDAPAEKLPSAQPAATSSRGPGRAKEIGGVLPGIILVLGVYWFVMRRRRKKQSEM